MKAGKLRISDWESEAKKDFLSQMSHDLRTPLNALLAFSCEEMISGADESELRACLAKIHASGVYLLEIINNVLDIAQVETKAEEEIKTAVETKLYTATQAIGKGVKTDATEQSAIETQNIQEFKGEKAENELEGLEILLCEDNSINAEIVINLLSKQGCHVTWAEDGKQGLELFEKSEEYFYDIVLMDIRMPVMNGFVAAAAIRAAKRADAKCIPIIALTADAFEEDGLLFREAGINAYMLKPIEPRKLYALIACELKKGIEMQNRYQDGTKNKG